MAVELDRELEQLPPGTIEAINKLGDRHALNRAIHWHIHLDDIDRFLADKK
ncbi:MAG: hypothetical protein JXA46_16335 [Dehalococcoidales bacterium]|nr:hypothetical protein [Dehalococcoidales bacterium]